MRCVGVVGGIDGDGLNLQFARRADDAQSDLAAIGDEQTLYLHGLALAPRPIARGAI